MTRPSQNSPAGRGSYVRGLHPVDVAAVSLHTEARSFARPLTISSLCVRTTVHPGPSNSVGFAPGAFIRFRKKPQDKGGCNRSHRPHRAVSFLRHPEPLSEVSLDTLIKVSEATAEGKALAAKIFKLNFDTQAELHALLMRATELAGGKP